MPAGAQPNVVFRSTWREIPEFVHLLGSATYLSLNTLPPLAFSHFAFTAPRSSRMGIHDSSRSVRPSMLFVVLGFDTCGRRIRTGGHGWVAVGPRVAMFFPGTVS